MGLDRDALGLASCFVARFGDQSRFVIDRMIQQSFADGMVSTAAFLTLVELAVMVLEENPERSDRMN
jgi:hypothetical protein